MCAGVPGGGAGNGSVTGGGAASGGMTGGGEFLTLKPGGALLAGWCTTRSRHLDMQREMGRC
jgi:hypothetical protein